MADEELRDILGIGRKDAKSDGNETEGRDDFFSRFMFGGREPEPVPEIKKAGVPRFLDDIDLDQLLSHVDTLITSAQELKPLFSKAKPYLEQFMNKQKS